MRVYANSRRTAGAFERHAHAAAQRRDKPTALLQGWELCRAARVWRAKKHPGRARV